MRKMTCSLPRMSHYMPELECNTREHGRYIPEQECNAPAQGLFGSIRVYLCSPVVKKCSRGSRLKICVSSVAHRRNAKTWGFCP
jgi:hypothetical protein